LLKKQLVTITLKVKTKFNLFKEKVEFGSGPFTKAGSGSGPRFKSRIQICRSCEGSQLQMR
jgi:hypothetical protein